MGVDFDRVPRMSHLGRRLGAKVGVDDGVVGAEAGGRSLQHDLSAREDVAVVGDFQRLAGVLLDPRGNISRVGNTRQYRLCTGNPGPGLLVLGLILQDILIGDWAKWIKRGSWYNKRA